MNKQDIDVQFHKYKGYIITICKQVAQATLSDTEDLYQESYIRLRKILNNWKPDRNKSVKSYISNYLKPELILVASNRNSLIKLSIREKRNKNEQINISSISTKDDEEIEYLLKSTDNIQEQYDTELYYKYLMQLFRKAGLSKKEKVILLFLTDDTYSYTPKSKRVGRLAEYYNIYPQQVYRYKRTSLNKVKDYLWRHREVERYFNREY